MNKKLDIINYVQLALWILNSIALLIIVVIDKDVALLNDLFVVFWALLLGTPLIFSVTKLVILERLKPTSVNKQEWVPFIGICVNALFSFVFFIRSVNTVGIILTVILVLVLIAIVVFKLKKFDLEKYSFRNHAVSLGICLVSYCAFIIGLVYISYYFSVAW